MMGLRALVLGALIVFTQKIASALSAPEMGFESPKRKCWLFAHQNKSGGSSVKRLLEMYLDGNIGVTRGLYDSDQWKSGNEYAQSYLQRGKNITWGSYTEGLRSYAAQDCQWFTMFRQ